MLLNLVGERGSYKLIYTHLEEGYDAIFAQIVGKDKELWSHRCGANTLHGLRTIHKHSHIVGEEYIETIGLAEREELLSCGGFAYCGGSRCYDATQ